MGKLLIIAAVCFVLGAGIAGAAFSIADTLTDEARSAIEYTKYLFPTAKVGKTSQETATTFHQISLLEAAEISPDIEDVNRFLADNHQPIGTLVKVKYRHAGDQYVMICVFENQRQKICQQFIDSDSE